MGDTTRYPLEVAENGVRENPNPLPLEQENVLIVSSTEDDDRKIVRDISRFLRENGYRVREEVTLFTPGDQSYDGTFIAIALAVQKIIAVVSP